LVLDIYKILNKFPKSEEYGITSQLKRAVVSIPTNIVEGHSRNSNKDFLRFVYISRGSLEEVKYLMFLSKELGYIKHQEYTKIANRLSELSNMLNGFIKFLRNNLNNPNNLNNLKKTNNVNNSNNFNNLNNQNNLTNHNNFNNSTNFNTKDIS